MRLKLIVYSEVSWGFLDQRHHHLARYFASEGYEVQFVERVLNRIPPLRSLLAAVKQRMSSFLAGQLVRLPSKPVPLGIQLRRSLFLPHSYRVFRPWNYFYWLLFERSRQRDAILYNFVDNPVLFGGELARYRCDYLAIFDVIHNWWAFPWHSTYHRRAAALTVALADHVVTDSDALRNSELASLNSVHVMLPGVASYWFTNARSLAEESPSAPRAAFFGNLRGNSDLPFVESVASAVGLDVYGLISDDAAALRPILRIKGQVSATALPDILATYNVLVLPYNRDEFSATIAPAKYFEALATGALLITRASLNHLPGFDEFCVVVGEETGCVLLDLLHDRLKEHQGKREAQIAFARSQTWEARFSDLQTSLKV